VKEKIRGREGEGKGETGKRYRRKKEESRRGGKEREIRRGKYRELRKEGKGRYGEERIANGDRKESKKRKG
jgi:hypothetical protein